MTYGTELSDVLVLALDIGTSSTRAILFDRRGQAIHDSECQIAYELTSTADGGAELRAETLFETVCQTIDSALAHATGAIAAVGISCFWHSLFGLNEAGDPATPVYLWADTRSVSYVEAIKQEFNATELWSRTGCFVHSSYWPGKLRWLADTDRARFASVRTWCAFSDYLLRRLLGYTATSVSMASATAMMNVETAQWDPLAIEAAKIDQSTLPPISADRVLLGPLAGEWVRRWPELSGSPWFAGYGDGACANIGSGGTGPKRIALTVGTSGAVRMVGPIKQFSKTQPDLWTYRVDTARAVVGAAISNGGKVIDWFAEISRGQTGDADWEAASAMPVDQHGLTILPFLAGERAPIWNDRATATISGLRLATTRADLIRAGMEAVTWRLAGLYRSLTESIAGDHQIIANGGAILHSPAWLQLLADAFEHPIIALRPGEEASARGAALLALESAGFIDSLDDADDPARDGRTIAPRPEQAEMCRAAIARQDQLLKALYDRGGHPVLKNP